MEKMAQTLSSKIANQMHYDEDKEAVIAYGLTAIFQIFVIALLISVIGIICDFWYESLIIFFGVGLLKKSTGGAHSRSIYSCIIISVLSISFFAMLSRYIFRFSINIYISFALPLFVFILCFIIFNKKVPVDSPNKPIQKPEKIKRLRRQSTILLIIYTALTYAFIILAPHNERFQSLSFCIHFILLWQTYMLTKNGMRFITLIDIGFNIKEV